MSSHHRRLLLCFSASRFHTMCTHTHTHKRRGIDPRDEPRFLWRELEKNGHRPLTFLETGVAASFMRSPPFPFQPCVHTVTWLLYRRPCIIDHLTSLWNSFTFPPLARTNFFFLFLGSSSLAAPPLSIEKIRVIVIFIISECISRVKLMIIRYWKSFVQERWFLFYFNERVRVFLFLEMDIMLSKVRNESIREWNYRDTLESRFVDDFFRERKKWLGKVLQWNYLFCFQNSIDNLKWISR